MLDANLNRCREGLRTAEDVARFVLDDAELAGALRTLRHVLTGAFASLEAEATGWRDTPGDVGISSKHPSADGRADVAHLAIAGVKRAQEALRVLAEVAKLESPPAAATAERVRYAAYDLERRLRLALRANEAFGRVKLYLILTQSACRADWFATAEAAVAGGVDCLQLREPGVGANELLARARRLRDLCRDANILLIVNDRPDVALLAKADGVHVGQNDLPAAEARRIVGPRAIVGVSTHDVDQVRQAKRDGANYVGVGPVFPSKTKPRDILPGLAFARAAAELDLLPTVAIAGITLGNVAEVRATGVSAVAVASAITAAEDPDRASRELRAQLTSGTTRSPAPPRSPARSGEA